MVVLSKLCSDLGFRLLPYNCYEVGHTWTPSCVEANMDVLKACFFYSIKIYSVFYLVTTVVKRPKLNEIGVKRLLLDVIRSSIFLSSNGFLFLLVLCLLRRSFGFFIFPNAGLVNGVIASYIAISLERPRRRRMLALYLVNLATETLFRMAVNRGLVTSIPNGEVLIFMLTLAGFFSLFRLGRLDESSNRALRFVFGAGRDTPWFSLDSFPHFLSVWLGELRRIGRSSDLCTHPYSCLSSFVEGFLRNFSLSLCLSFGIQVSYNFSSVFRAPLKTLPKLLIKSSKLPLFLGCLPAFYSGSLCLFRRRMKVDNAQVHALSGFLCGLAMFLYPSTSVSLYLMWKLIEILYMKSNLPRCRNADKWLYAFSTGFVLFAGVLEPHALRPAYWTFLKNLTGQYFTLVNRKTLDVFGCDSSFLYPNFVPILDPLHTTGNPAFLPR